MTFEPIAQGFYLEALLIDGDSIWYSDVVEGGICRMKADGTVHTWLPERRLVGGLLLNEDGAMLVSGHDGIVWFNPESGATGILLDQIEGQPIDGVNEMRPDGKGGIYFGTIDMPAIVRGEKPGPAGLYHLDADRKLTTLCTGLVFTNGLTPNLAGTRLFHNESFVGTFAYELNSDGSLGSCTKLLDKTDCDGMALDVEGNVWISGFASNELLRMQPDGTIIERMPLPGEAATNVRFGGDDGRDLYITIVSPKAAAAIARGEKPSSPSSRLYRGRSSVAGQAISRTRFALG